MQRPLLLSWQTTQNKELGGPRGIATLKTGVQNRYDRMFHQGPMEGRVGFEPTRKQCHRLLPHHLASNPILLSIFWTKTRGSATRSLLLEALGLVSQPFPEMFCEVLQRDSHLIQSSGSKVLERPQRFQLCSFGYKPKASATMLRAQSCFGGVFPQPGTLG